MDAKRYAPAAERNREPILQVLREVFPATGTVLEIAAGTGMHAVYFARALPGLTWQPTDADPSALASIAAWREDEGTPNLREPLQLNVTQHPWPVDSCNAVLCINMIHIAPWEATEALFAGAAALLQPQEPLVLYGPFQLDGEHTAPSNAAFHTSLQQRDPRWGVRDLGHVEAAGRQHSFTLEQRVAMPANNFTVVFRKAAG